MKFYRVSGIMSGILIVIGTLIMFFSSLLPTITHGSDLPLNNFAQLLVSLLSVLMTLLYLSFAISCMAITEKILLIPPVLFLLLRLVTFARTIVMIIGQDSESAVSFQNPVPNLLIYLITGAALLMMALLKKGRPVCLGVYMLFLLLGYRALPRMIFFFFETVFTIGPFSAPATSYFRSILMQSALFTGLMLAGVTLYLCGQEKNKTTPEDGRAPQRMQPLTPGAGPGLFQNR